MTNLFTMLTLIGLGIAHAETITWTLHPKIMLVGYGITPKSGFAAIQERGTPNQKLFVIGETIPDVGVLESVVTGTRGLGGAGIIINNNGNKMYIAYGSIDYNGVSTPTSTTPSAASQSKKISSEPAISVELNQLSQALAKGEALVTEANPNPIAVAGDVIGVRLQNITEDSFFNSLNLRTGDIVKAINGTKVENPAAIPGLLQQMRNDPNFNIEIVRSNRPMTLNYEAR